MPRPLQSLESLSIALMIGLSPLAMSADDSWSAFRGPDGTGRARHGLPPGDAPLDLELVWKRPLGSGYSGLSVVGGKLLTAVAEGEQDFVVALARKTGEELWRRELAPTYGGHDGSHDGPISTPAIAAGRVFMLSPWGHLAALDLESGEALWRVHLVDDLGCERPLYGFGSSPVVVDDIVVLQIGGDEGAVAGFDSATGDVRWRAVPDPSGVGSQSPIFTEIGGRDQILVLASQKLAGVDPADGSVLWELDLEGEPGSMGGYTQSPLPIGEDRILVKHRDEEAAIVQVTRSESGLTAEIVAESRSLARSYSPPTLAGDELYGYSARFLSGADPSSGDLLWRSREPGDGFLLSVGGQLAVLTKTGSLHLGPASRDGWHETARLDLFSDLAWTPPSYSDGSLYVRSLGEIARIDLVRPQASLAADAAVRGGALPSVLAPLARALDGVAQPGAVVENFLAGRALPLVEGDEVVFLWRGEAEDVAIAGDMIGMRREEPMQRLGDTDLWWWATELDRRARISYLFFVDYIPTTDPSHGRTTSSTVLGPNMDWFRGEPMEMSWFAMPEWPGLALSAAEPAVEAAGRLETFELTLRPPAPEGGETPEPVQVPVQVWLPPGYDQAGDRYPVVYLHNTFAREEGAWPETLDRVVGRTVAPLIAVFPDPPRMRGFGDLFVDQLVPQIDERYRTRAERDGRANVGMGWPGFSASAMTFRHAEKFGLLGIQSLFLLDEPKAVLEEAIGEADASTTPMKIYLEWGRWDLISPHEEMNMRASSQWAWDFLGDRGWEPIGGEVWDSTDFASWRNRTGVLLEALFPREGSASALGGWQTGR